MPKLFSYVVEHDYGLSPNPSGGYCTLAFCKFKKKKNRNIVELAEAGDWVVGTGGKSSTSAGSGKLVYVMRITEKMTLQKYFRDPRFVERAGNDFSVAKSTTRFALISDHYFYFGSEGPLLEHDIDRGGRGMRNQFTEDEICAFVDWLKGRYPGPGEYGPPCVDLRDDGEDEQVTLDVVRAPARKPICIRRPRRIC
jgi:hypothetical protein